MSMWIPSLSGTTMETTMDSLGNVMMACFGSGINVSRHRTWFALDGMDGTERILAAAAWGHVSDDDTKVLISARHGGAHGGYTFQAAMKRIEPRRTDLWVAIAHH